MSDFDHELQAPPVVFPGQSAPESAYRTAFDLLARRAPREALDVVEPALAEDPGNTGLRTLRAWAFLMRAQLQRAEAELVSLVEEDPADDWLQHALGRCLERQSWYAEALPHLRLAATMSGDPRARGRGAPGGAAAGRDRRDVVRQARLRRRGPRRT